MRLTRQTSRRLFVLLTSALALGVGSYAAPVVLSEPGDRPAASLNPGLNPGETPAVEANPQLINASWQQNLVGITGSGVPLGDFLLHSEGTIVHFWAEWCAPCRAELATLSKFYAENLSTLQAQGLELVTINNDPTLASAQLATTEFGLNAMPVFHDPDFGVNYLISGTKGVLPLTYLVFPDGESVTLAVGPLDWEAAPLFTRLRSIMSKKDGNSQ